MKYLEILSCMFIIIQPLSIFLHITAIINKLNYLSLFPGAVTVFAVNFRQIKDQIQLRIPSWTGRNQEKKVYQYIITPARSDNDLTSK